MRFAKSRIVGSASILLVLFLPACGGSGSPGSRGSSSGSGGNAQSIGVNAGPAGNYANGLFTTVTVCAPGSSNCQPISGVLVDTGSYGLRVLASALGGLSGSLPQQNDPSGNSVVECAQFATSVIWGPVKSADVTMAGEKASSIPIQVIDTSTIPVASSCSAHNPAEETLSQLGANGILGIGYFIQDCGQACATPPGTGSNNPGFYYSCAGSSCSVIAESPSAQLENPVAAFATDNNGVIVSLPAVSGSMASLSGSLIFGIGTQSNNALGSAQVYALDTSGNIKTMFNATSYSAFLDSGSNAYFFPDLTLPTCASSAKGFYCPSSPVNLSAVISPGPTGVTSPTATINFTIDNASSLFVGSNTVFPTLGGPNSKDFDWGLPFFYGRQIFTAIETRSTPGGMGPYWAF